MSIKAILNESKKTKSKKLNENAIFDEENFNDVVEATANTLEKRTFFTKRGLLSCVLPTSKFLSDICIDTGAYKTYTTDGSYLILKFKSFTFDRYFQGDARIVVNKLEFDSGEIRKFPDLSKIGYMFEFISADPKEVRVYYEKIK